MLKEVTGEIYFTDTEVNVTQENREKDEMEEKVKRRPERKNSVDDFFRAGDKLGAMDTALQQKCQQTVNTGV